MVERLALLEFIGIAIEEIGGFLHLAQRFHSILAHLQRQCRCNVEYALLDELRHPMQILRTLGRRSALPSLPCLVRGLQGLFRFVDRGDRELAQHGALIDRTAVRYGARPAAIGAGNVDVVAAPQSGSGLVHRLVETSMQLRRRGEHRGVGEFEAHGARP